MLCREAEASKASPGCGRILKHDPPSVPACSPAVTMSSLSCCLSRSTILCCLNQFWPQGSIYMRLTRPNIQTQAHACVFSDARTHTQGYRRACAKTHLRSPRTSLASAFYANQTKVGSAAVSVESRWVLFCLPPPPPLLHSVLFKSTHLPVVSESAG